MHIEKKMVQLLSLKEVLIYLLEDVCLFLSKRTPHRGTKNKADSAAVVNKACNWTPF